MLGKEDKAYSLGIIIGFASACIVMFSLYTDIKSTLNTPTNSSRDYRYYADKYRNEALIYKALFNKLQDIRTHDFMATSYFSNDKTALGTKPNKGWTAAVSRDHKNWLGKRVFVYDEDETYGVFKVEDLTAEGKKDVIDLFMGHAHESKKDFGKRPVTVLLID